MRDLRIIFLFHGWAAGNSGKILYTSNGGFKWFNQVSGTSNNLNSIHFNNFTGWAAGNGSIILKTIDRGFNWTTQVSGMTGNLNSIYFSDNNVTNIFNNSSAFVSGYVSTVVNGDNFTDLADVVLAHNNSTGFAEKITPLTQP